MKLRRWVQFDDNKGVDPNPVVFMLPLTGWPTGPREHRAHQPLAQTDPRSDFRWQETADGRVLSHTSLL